jgi:hypothetical protein
LVGLFLIIYVKSIHKNQIKEFSIDTINRGALGIAGNKGAIGCRFKMNDTTLCFVKFNQLKIDQYAFNST